MKFDLSPDPPRKKHSKKELANLKPGIPGVLPPQFVANSGKGRPAGSRNRIQVAFLNALADDFDKYGKQAIVRMRETDASGYVKAIVALMPKQFEQTTPLEELSDAELIAGIELLKSKLAVGVVEGTRAPHKSKPLN